MGFNKPMMCRFAAMFILVFILLGLTISLNVLLIMNLDRNEAKQESLQNATKSGEDNIDNCDPNPCQNNGICTDLVSDFKCNCTDGLTGKICDSYKDVDDCDPNPCQNNGTCTDLVNDFKCNCTGWWSGKICDLYKDCVAKLQSGANTSGIYSDISPDEGPAISVYCDMVTDGGGWTVIQRRLNGSVDFNLTWSNYKQGFGTLSGEFWLGNDNIHRLTTIGNVVLRIELWNNTKGPKYAEYSSFMVDNEINNYTLTVGPYSGTTSYNAISGSAGKNNHSGKYFSTKDRDNDIAIGYNCAESFGSGWWFGGCGVCNLNGPYKGDAMDPASGPWKGSPPPKKVEMKLKSPSP